MGFEVGSLENLCRTNKSQNRFPVLPTSLGMCNRVIIFRGTKSALREPKQDPPKNTSFNFKADSSHGVAQVLSKENVLVLRVNKPLPY